MIFAQKEGIARWIGHYRSLLHYPSWDGSLSPLGYLSNPPWREVREKCLWYAFKFLLISLKSFASFYYFLKPKTQIMVHCIPVFLLQWPLLRNNSGAKAKVQQTKMLVTCQRFSDLFLFGLVWQYSSVQTKYNKGRFKVMATYLQQ